MSQDRPSDSASLWLQVYHSHPRSRIFSKRYNSISASLFPRLATLPDGQNREFCCLTPHLLCVPIRPHRINAVVGRHSQMLPYVPYQQAKTTLCLSFGEVMHVQRLRLSTVPSILFLSRYTHRHSLPTVADGLAIIISRVATNGLWSMVSNR